MRKKGVEIIGRPPVERRFPIDEAMASIMSPQPVIESPATDFITLGLMGMPPGRMPGNEYAPLPALANQRPVPRAIGGVPSLPSLPLSGPTGLGALADMPVDVETQVSRALAEAQQGMEPFSFPNLNRQRPPVATPPFTPSVPARDQEGDKDAALRSLDAVKWLPLLGMLTGDMSYGARLVPGAANAALTGTNQRRNRDLEEAIRAWQLSTGAADRDYTNQRQYRGDQVDDIDSGNALTIAEYEARQRHGREQRDLLSGIARETRLTATAEARAAKDRKDAEAKESEAKRKAVATVSDILRGVNPNDPASVAQAGAIVNPLIEKYNIELTRDETGRIVPVQSAQFGLQDNRNRAAMDKQERKHVLDVALDDAKSGNRMFEESLKHLGRKELQQAVLSNRLTIAQANNVVRQKIANDRIAVINRQASLRSRLGGAGDVDTKIRQINRDIASYQRSIGVEQGRLKPMTDLAGDPLPVPEDVRRAAESNIALYQSLIEESRAMKERLQSGGIGGGTTQPPNPTVDPLRGGKMGRFPEGTVGADFQKLVGTQGKKFGCADAVCDILGRAGIKPPSKTSSAKGMLDAAAKSPLWERVPADQVKPYDLVGWYSESANSKRHVAIALQPGTALGNPGRRSKYQYTWQSIPRNAEAWRFVGYSGDYEGRARAKSGVASASKIATSTGRTLKVTRE